MLFFFVTKVLRLTELTFFQNLLFRKHVYSLFTNPQFFPMKTALLILSFLSACFGSTQTKPANMENAPAKTLYDFKATTIDGKMLDLSQFKGKKVLIINTASQCGFTPQYKDLEKLHETYGDKLVLLGFPANDFGGQEPGTNTEIASFCSKNYGVKFQMMEKVKVKKGEGQSPLYQWLTSKTENGWNDQEPTWNFCKYLINEKGELVKFFPSKVGPMSEELTAALK
jgi:glutathione peroxidase